MVIVDEVSSLPSGQDAATLCVQLASSRYEHASLILTGNLPFSSWAGVFGDPVVAAMIDRIVHHADVIALKGAPYRFRDRGIDTLPSIKAEQQNLTPTVHSSTAGTDQNSSAVHSQPPAWPRHPTDKGRFVAPAF